MVFLDKGDASSAASNYNQAVSSFAELLQALMKLAEKQKEEDERLENQPENSLEDQEKLLDVLDDHQATLDRQKLDEFDQRLDASKGKEPMKGSVAERVGRGESLVISSPQVTQIQVTQVTKAQVTQVTQVTKAQVAASSEQQYSFNQGKDGSIQIAKASGERLIDFNPQSGVKVHKGCSRQDQANVVSAIAGVQVAKELLKGGEGHITGKNYSFNQGKDGSIQVAKASGQPLIRCSPESGLKTYPGFGKQDQEAFIGMFSELQKAQQQQSAQNTGRPTASKSADKGGKTVDIGGRSR